MKVWLMRYDLDRYNYIIPIKLFTVEEIWALKDGKSLAKTWKPRKYKLAKRNKQPLSDAPGFEFLILSPRAYDILKDIMGNSVEVLDVLYEGEKYYGIHILSMPDIFDYENSKYETFNNSDKVLSVDKYCFRMTDELKENHIFKIKEAPYEFVTDEFKAAVEENNLKGFRFELVWQSDSKLQDIEQECSEENKEESIEYGTEDSRSMFSYKYAADIDDIMQVELDKTVEHAIKAFNIKNIKDGKAVAEQIYEIVEGILKNHTSPEGYNNIEDVAVALGTLYGYALCLEYGWKWMMLGENRENACLNVISGDRQYSHMPLAFIYRILKEENINIDGTNDNTVLLLFNMIKELADKKSEYEFYPIG